MKIVGVVQSRLASTRLPRKALADIHGHPAIWRVYKRLQWTPGIAECVLSVPVEDAPVFHEVGFAYGMNVTTGPEEDILTRLLVAAYATKADIVAVVGGDCPLTCPYTNGQLLRRFVQTKGRCDFVSNCIKRTFPDGLDIEVYTTSLLASLDARLTGKDREWVGQWCRENLPDHMKFSFRNDKDWSEERWALDWPEDLRFIQRVYAEIGTDIFTFTDVLRVLSDHPEYRKINEHLKDPLFGGRP